MEPERERPEMQPMPALTPGERVPMPAGPGSRPRQAGAKGVNILGVAGAAILTAALAAAIVFKGDFRPPQQAAPAETAAMQVSVAGPLSKTPPAPTAPTTTPSAAPAEPPSSPLPGSLPTETNVPAPGNFSSPLPFFSSDESEVVPKVSALQPYNNGQQPAQSPADARPVLPAANRLTPRLQPFGRAAAIPRAAGGFTAAASAGPCTNCKTAVSGTKTSVTLQGGKGYVQHEIATVYTGVCEGKHVYEYTNLTSNMTIGMKVVTTAGESWTFKLKPGEKMSIKSSTELSGGNFETYRTSEVIN